MSEIGELKELLLDIPVESVINRASVESRILELEEMIAGYVELYQPKKIRLTFRGKYVKDTHGIVADFAATVAEHFATAYATIAAAMYGDLKSGGPVPGKAENALVITGTAIGSFGFEFELPMDPDQISPNQVVEFQIARKPEIVMQMMQDLLRTAAVGSDDELADLIEQLKPRAVRSVARYLDYLGRSSSYCGVEFGENHFQFEGVEQVNESARRLAEDNIRESEETYDGEFIGVLPVRRTFEFKLIEHDNVIAGKLGSGVEEPDKLNLLIHVPKRVRFHVMVVGEGKPKYTLHSLTDIE